MEVRTTEINEKDFQLLFYQSIFGDNWRLKVWIDRETDGHMGGILFEHKKNLTSYGIPKALGQALIYLSRFNRDGIPVPRYTCLVSQDEGFVIFIDNNYYVDYINDIKNNAYLIASRGIPSLLELNHASIIDKLSFSLDSNPLYKYLIAHDNDFVKVSINEDNVVGWARYYYNHCLSRKAKKIKLFEELRNPREVLNIYIEPWVGKETDFKLIMDLLNDPTEQKKIGAFYTPIAYAEKACELVIDAIKRVPEGNDYVIIDRCAGTGNLEWCLNDYSEDCGDDILSHVIVSSPELKEWEVLRTRLGGRVRHLLPECEGTPEITEYGYLAGSNALTEEFLNNPIIKQYVDNDKCSIILFENPPYAQGSSVTNQKNKVGKEACEWKNNYIVNEMKKEIAGQATNELCNAFIWSGFKYYLRQSTDSYIVFAPPKYWKYHNLVNKKMKRGFGFNRQFFHASSALISCIEWTNIDDAKTEELTLEVYNVKDEINGGGVERVSQDVYLRKIHSIHSQVYYDRRTFDDDKKNDGILVDPNGYDVKHLEKNIRPTATPVWNENIIGYLISKGSTLDTPGLDSNLLISQRYDGHGCFLRKDNYYQYLPAFAASNYLNNVKTWTGSIYGNSGDMADHYWMDIEAGRLDDFLFKTLLWCCMTQYNHMVSQPGSDGKTYLNQICLQEGTLARKHLNEHISKGYELTEEEKELFDLYNQLMRSVVRTSEYNPKFTYGIYQVSKEIDTTYKDERGTVRHNHGDVQNLLSVIKSKAQNYYVKEIAPILLKYEMVK